MNAHRTEATIDKDGTLILRDVPFQPGAQVEVIILERTLHSNSEGKDQYLMCDSFYAETRPSRSNGSRPSCRFKKTITV
jgi:hypothetical protein